MYSLRNENEQAPDGFTWHSDPGHAWLEVSYLEHPDALTCATGWGYVDMSRGLIYLEEDSEAPRFFALHPAAVNNFRVIRYYSSDAPLRGLARNLEHVGQVTA